MLFFFSCWESEQDEIKRVIREWRNKEIRFPAHSTFLLGEERVEVDFSDSDYKVVMYLDSAGCTGCRAQLPEWEMFIQEVNQQKEEEKEIAYLFYIVAIAPRFIDWCGMPVSLIPFVGTKRMHSTS